ncbi:hypothetical protein E8D34_15665 [Nocardioides sp. GY 10113]|uniref:CARDB domain-containing protein n=1 Tax=Nocardioides sp. GY 10113 TaxID=2569761 RepID=UPI0010A91B52|nr:CARDB domain-containing protein [Nocardioides sp. GY 10113]TIC83565.1 hypothetical protein E8D34_15665 [Nocardioides sp. GY 10113]
MRARRRTVLATIVLLAGTTAAAATAVTAVAPAQAAARPDLRVAAVTAPATVVRGARLAVSAKVRAARGSRAAASRTRFLLSRDRRASANDAVLATVRTPAVAGGARRTVTARGAARVATGRWYVIACADATRTVRERREGNNCRASSAPVRVEAKPTAPPPGDGLAHTPNPIDVDHEVDVDAARSVDVGTSGGEVSATGTDGTRYRLTIPRDALLSPATITLAPVASVEGAPVTGPVRAVEITPHGLMLLEPATLTITPPDGADLTGGTGFLFDEGGLDFHAYPAEVTPGSATIGLLHFSTPGIAAPADGQVAPGSGRWPRRAQSQLEAAAADLLARERQRQEDGAAGDADLEEKLEQLLGEYERDVLQPALRDGTRCGAWQAARAAVAAASTLGKQRQLVGLTSGPEYSDLTRRLIHDVRIAQADCAHRSCVDDHHIGSAHLLMGEVRQYVLRGEQDEIDRLEPMLRDCLTFQVEVRATVAGETHWLDGAAAGLGGRFYYTYDKSARLDGGTTMTLRPDPRYGLNGQGETLLTEFRHVEDGRDADGKDLVPFSVRATTWDPGVASARLDFDFNAYLPIWADGWRYFPPVIAGQVVLDVRSSALAYGVSVNDPLTETYTRTSGAGTTTTQTQTWVSAVEQLAYALLPQSGIRPAVVLRARDQAGATLLDRTWTRTRALCIAEADAQCEETTTLRVVLTHTPGA